MQAQHVASAFAGLPELHVTAATTRADSATAVRVLASFNQSMVGVIRFAGGTPWERHIGDELLYVVQGTVDVSVLLDDGVQQTTLSEGELFVVPKDRWHRQVPKPAVSLMFVTPLEGNDASWADDPRLDGERPTQRAKSEAVS